VGPTRREKGRMRGNISSCTPMGKVLEKRLKQRRKFSRDKAKN